MNHPLTTKISNRNALEERYGKETIEHAIRLGWIDEEDNKIKPTLMEEILWKRVQKSLIEVI